MFVDEMDEEIFNLEWYQRLLEQAEDFAHQEGSSADE